ncbi:MAG: ABC transporter permease [Anaerolineales bacterium]|nr:ABC transporter permease [Anaerolineales bacterium]MCB0005016.1 ABC transporter permease [Anaerolineales bacterium]MCB0010683.1 ABC transporter permease [Anaerolineales bacterium]MCB0017782.1 ABC transporter permease [Anaerolineales bacterium]MCB8960897.1 ABC transporter permease [Ardenticatenales bacterium]
MARYIVNRLLVSIPVFFGITLIVYGLFALSPGDPVINIIGFASYVEMTPEQVEAVRAQYGLDQPWLIRYVRWLGDAVQGDLGYPFKGSMSVAELIGQRLGPTLLLMGTAFLTSLLIGIPLGVLMGLKQYSFLDYFLTVITFFNLSIPNFFLALGVIYIFALKLDFLPTNGMQTIGSDFSIGDRLAHLVLPTLVLGSFYAAVWARYARSSILEVLSQDYIRTARAKGLLEWTVVARHAFRNALLPLVTVVTLSLPQLLGGAIIVETIFQWPGLGMLGWRATTTRDYPILMGVTLISATMILLSNLLADVLYGIVDPRIRYD